jgi:transposase
MNRVECVGEAIRHTLNILAMVAPDWLCRHSQPEWIDRYGPRAEDSRFPKSETQRQTLAR